MIIFENVSKRYRTKNTDQIILNKLNMVFPSGHNIGILGSNGAGKSTFIRMLAGTEMPDSGRIYSDKKYPGHLVSPAVFTLLCQA